MKLQSSELRSRLAAEYVLGTLKGAARRRFSDYVRRDDVLRQEVEAWERRLLPLVNHLPSVEPPGRVWQGIERRLGFELNKAKSSSSWWWNISFWRSLGLGASTCAALLLAFVVARPQESTKPMMTSVLAAGDEAKVLIEQPRAGLLKVSTIAPMPIEKGMGLELWVIDREGKALSLGKINARGETHITIPALDDMINAGATLAVSEESNTTTSHDKPLGKVICKGAMAKMGAERGLPI